MLIRDVAYGQIPRAERSAKHLQTAGWIESLGRVTTTPRCSPTTTSKRSSSAPAAGVDVGSFAGAAHAAFSDAGDRAAALNANAAAGRYYRAALELLPEGDDRRYRLLLKLGDRVCASGEQATDLLQQAADGLGATGDVEGAAAAETRLAEQSWLDGDREASFAHLYLARELADPLPPSRVKVHAIGTASRFRMLASDDHEAIRLGLEALAMAEELGLDDVRAGALNNIGAARSSLGDPRGLEDMAEATRWQLPRTPPSSSAARRAISLRTSGWTRGSRRRLRSGRKRAPTQRATASPTSDAGLRGDRPAPFHDGTVGRHACALTRSSPSSNPADRITSPRRSTPVERSSGSRGAERAGALADAELALEAARRVQDKQALLPTLARVAHIRRELDDPIGAATAADEFLAALHEGHVGFALSSAHELSWTLTALDRGVELVPLLSEQSHPWARAAVAYAQGDPLRAAEISSQSGALAEEAYARLNAARLAGAQGRHAEAREQLDQALAFYRSVGASRYVAEAEAFRAASP